MTDAAGYADLREAAAETIRDFGKPAVVLVRGEQSTAEEKPWRPVRGDPEDIPVHYVEGNNSLTLRPSTVVEQGDIFGFMAVSADMPDLDTTARLRVGDLEYAFQQLEPLAPGPVVLLYEFHARR
jgi:hypothetical protein